MSSDRASFLLLIYRLKSSITVSRNLCSKIIEVNKLGPTYNEFGYYKDSATSVRCNRTRCKQDPV